MSNNRAYVDTFRHFLESGNDILLTIQNFEDNFSEKSAMKKEIVRPSTRLNDDFQVWRTGFLSYLKIHFSIQGSAYIELIEESNDYNSSTVKLYLGILHQILDGIITGIVHPDCNLLEKEEAQKNVTEIAIMEIKAHHLSRKIANKIPTITFCFTISIVIFVLLLLVLWMIDPWRAAGFNHRDFFDTTHMLIAFIFSSIVSILFYLIKHSMLITRVIKLEGQIKLREKKPKSKGEVIDEDLKNSSDSVHYRLFEEMPSQIAEAILSEINNGNYFNNKTDKPLVTTTGSRLVFRTQMRELFHSLLTPITTINRSLTSINISKGDDDFAKVLNDGLESIENSISYIDALLYAYRSLAMLNFNTEDSNVNLKKFVSNTIKALCEQTNKTVDVSIDENFSEIAGFPSQFIVALLLPLLQNAVESSPENNIITLIKLINDDRVIIEIQNSTEQLVASEDLQKGNFTTKYGSHEGLGLSAVRNIAKEMNIIFEIYSEGKSVTAKLAFPKKIKN